MHLKLLIAGYAKSNVSLWGRLCSQGIFSITERRINQPVYGLQTTCYAILYLFNEFRCTAVETSVCKKLIFERKQAE